mmetsp:Transcript_41550/g.104786  ORF Transcript_41550/g.104786 Transcript_41550/m.104786 type:complete len:476 (+) Transcript_41550:67-1494(+)|eukprot:CAMPEP_0177651564 /NCGR_PEP_ID=MMETSP0447-20121125/12628_1 /TAXON_ID=0 /ORGANISM="Stygamoeba regulata, Strain BSH-02190019" /LENGTH=475 /DNA_ID=CAMNT_0019154679 /DNA_START=1069 /DNA_END=2496 /DNA_ORIENTATION=-
MSDDFDGRVTTVAQVDETVERLRASFMAGKTRPLAWRRQQLEGLKAMMNENKDRIVRSVMEDLGKQLPIEVLASEYNLPLTELEETLHSLSRWASPEDVYTPIAAQPATSHIYQQPKGVVLIISPWNYPCNLALVPLIGALAAGNAVFLKVSAYAANTASTLVELLPRYLDTSCVAVEGVGGRQVIKQLLANRWDHIFFTGSVSVGRLVGEAAGRNLTPCTLELGGKNPCIVDATVDVRLAARRIAWGKFFNTGQTCIGVDYLLCDERIEAELIAALKEAVVQFYGEEPHQSASYGRIISEAHARRLQALMAHGEVVHGGEAVPAEKYVAPTILRAVDLASELMTDEIFGPLLPIITFKELDEALRFVNERPVCLALYFFSAESRAQERVLAGTRSGSAVINDVLMQFTNSALPFGGCGESGMGAYHGKRTFDTFTHKRAVMKSTARNWLDLPLRYPPYSDKKTWIVDKVTRSGY